MSMRVERASLKQVEHLSLFVGLKTLSHSDLGYIMSWWLGYVRQVVKCLRGYLSYLPIINFFWLQVQKRFESLKKRKDPSSFSEQDEKTQKHHTGCHFPLFAVDSCEGSLRNYLLDCCLKAKISPFACSSDLDERILKQQEEEERKHQRKEREEREEERAGCPE